MPKNLSLWVCKALAALSVLAGGGGMCLSFLSMACADLPGTVSGAAGFIAGAVLLGSGLIALALLSLTTALTARDSDLPALDSEP